MKKELERDFTFDEWDKLSFEEKRDIWNHYWNPYEPHIGENTRSAIISRFKSEHKAISEAALAISYEYFGFGVGAITVVIEDKKIRVPKSFSDVLINKGTVLKRINEYRLLVQWRDVGGKFEYTLTKDV